MAVIHLLGYLISSVLIVTANNKLTPDFSLKDTPVNTLTEQDPETLGDYTQHDFDNPFGASTHTPMDPFTDEDLDDPIGASTHTYVDPLTEQDPDDLIGASTHIPVDPLGEQNPDDPIADSARTGISGKWYTFLKDVYNKFSDYEIQKDRERYNVADLEDWGELGKPQGINIIPGTFEKFLDKIKDYNVTEYETVKNVSNITSSQIQELNQVLSSTLKQEEKIYCTISQVIVKGHFVSLKKVMTFLPSAKGHSCSDFKKKHAEGKYKLLKIFAAGKVFIDWDLSFTGKEMSVVIIAPQWQVVGYRSIKVNAADGPPHASQKAKNGTRPGEKGTDGAPGNPARCGESFLGIGTTFLNGKNLKINSNGGNGGRGQDGGDGVPGANGNDAPMPASQDQGCKNGRFKDFECAIMDEKKYNLVFLTKTESRIVIYGTNGGIGGKGGDGGKGGKGSNPGKIDIIELGQPSEIGKFIFQGHEGKFGRGGRSGFGGRNGKSLVLHLTEVIRTSNCFGSCITRFWTLEDEINRGSRLYPHDGEDGKNADGIQDPAPANGIPRPGHIVNEFKFFFRENIVNESYYHKFLDHINTNSNVRKLYDIFALIDDFLGLEEQFYKLSDKLDFPRFYSQSLNAVSEFAETRKNVMKSKENKKVLNYLYTSILGRIENFKEDSEQGLIVDMGGYLEFFTKNVEKIKNLRVLNNKVDIIDKYKEKYKISINKKIEEADYMIKKYITPEIENINREIDNQFNSLIEETISLRKKAIKDLEKLEEQKKKLGNTLALKGMLTCFQLTGKIVSLLGPIGSIASTAITISNNVFESLALDNKKTINIPANFQSNVLSMIGQIKKMRNAKVDYLNKLLEDLSKEIKNNPAKLKDLEAKVAYIKDKLKKVSENKLDYSIVKELDRELNRELLKKKDALKIHPDDKKSSNALKSIEKVIEKTQFGSFLVSSYEIIKDNKDKMDITIQSMKKMKAQIDFYREYEESIYNTMMPMMQEMENSLNDVSKKLKSKSQIALDVTKWQVQRYLKDMKLKMQQLTKGHAAEESISRSIEELNELMTTLITIYDRIQSYQDQEILAEYIADISSVAASSINIKDQQLVNATNRLEYVIRVNLLLKQYKTVMKSFEQWVFPLADRYLEKSMLPSQLEQTKDFESVLQKAIRDIEKIKNRLDKYKVSVMHGDQYLRREEFSSRYVSSKPFFVWRNENYKNTFSNLLSGRKVILNANVNNSHPKKDAIKFSEIDFHFKIKNSTAQSQLSEILKRFDIKATHLGNSHYRHGGKFFLINSDSVTLTYSYEKNEKGIPIRFNDVYNKLKKGDLLLSPYTLWEIQIINQTKNYSFQDLKKYEKMIDLELSGIGTYIQYMDSKPLESSTNTTGS